MNERRRNSAGRADERGHDNLRRDAFYMMRAAINLVQYPETTVADLDAAIHQMDRAKQLLARYRAASFPEKS